jgi:ATP-dependent Clp protease ATP-binding subunit ClpX
MELKKSFQFARTRCRRKTCAMLARCDKNIFSLKVYERPISWRHSNFNDVVDSPRACLCGEEKRALSVGWKECRMDAKKSNLSPQEILAKVDQLIVGQNHAKRSVIAAVHWNSRRAELAAEGVPLHRLPPKQNVLLIGPTGTGKTAIARAVASLMDVPVFRTTATSYSITGLVGLDPEDVITGLLDAAEGDVRRAERGIVVFDETDKLERRDWNGHADVGGQSIQQAMLSLLESCEAFVRGRNYDRVRVSTNHVTFIGTGVFNDAMMPPGQVSADALVRIGFIPEFVARFSSRIRLDNIELKHLRQIAQGSEASPISQLQYLFSLHGIELIFEQRAIDLLVELGMENGLGVRGLSQAIWERCSHLVSEIPVLVENSIARVVVDRRAVEGGSPWMIPGELKQPRKASPASASPQPQPIEWHPNLPRVSDTSGWSKAQIAERYKLLRKDVQVELASTEAKSFWKTFETKHRDDLRPAVRLCEVLVGLQPAGTAQEFFSAWHARPHVDERFVLFSMLSERYRGKATKRSRKKKGDADLLF